MAEDYEVNNLNDLSLTLSSIHQDNNNESSMRTNCELRWSYLLSLPIAIFFIFYMNKEHFEGKETTGILRTFNESNSGNSAKNYTTLENKNNETPKDYNKVIPNQQDTIKDPIQKINEKSKDGTKIINETNEEYEVGGLTMQNNLKIEDKSKETSREEGGSISLSSNTNSKENEIVPLAPNDYEDILKLLVGNPTHIVISYKGHHLEFKCSSRIDKWELVKDGMVYDEETQRTAVARAFKSCHGAMHQALENLLNQK